MPRNGKFVIGATKKGKNGRDATKICWWYLKAKYHDWQQKTLEAMKR
jgi:hypothetical protein